MMVTREQKRKMLDEVNSTIFSLYMQDRLNEKERNFLSGLLDLVIKGNKQPELTNVLRTWLDSNTEPDIDEIIKATLLNMEFAPDQAWKNDVEIIKGLL